MHKYPWHKPQYTFLSEVHVMHTTAVRMLTALTEDITAGRASPNDRPLLQTLLAAAMKSPGFSEKQRTALVGAVPATVQQRSFVSRLAGEWPFETLGRKTGASEHLVGVCRPLTLAVSPGHHC